LKNSQEKKRYRKTTPVCAKETWESRFYSSQRARGYSSEVLPGSSQEVGNLLVPKVQSEAGEIHKQE